MSPAGSTFSVVAVTLLISHTVADHWVQTGDQSRDKGLPGWPGRRACAAHVATYTLTTSAAVGAVWWLFDLPVTWWGFVAGQVVSAVTHYWADRRCTLHRLSDLLGKEQFYRLGAPREATAWTEQINNEEIVVTLEVRGDDPPGWDNPSLGTGAYALDQAWHWAWLGVAAVITAVI